MVAPMPARTPELSRPPLVGLRRPHRGRRQSGGVIRRLPPSRVRRVTRTRSDDTTVTSYQERLDRSAPTYNITAIPVRELEQGITNETENPSPQSAPASPKNERETMTDQCTSSLRDCSSTVELVPCETDPAPDYDAPAVPDYHEASLGVPGYTITPLHMSSCQPQTDLCSYQNMCRLPEPTECLPTPFYVQSSRRRRRHGRRNRHRNRRRRHYTQQQQDDGPLKPCCSLLGCKICMSMCLEFRKVLIFLASVGVACILIGVVLGVLRSPGNSFLTLALMFVGLGIMLLAVVLVGWKCTPQDHEPCHMLFGLGAYSTISRRGRRRRERLYWLGGMLYPEFRHRRPPPSYATAMLDYQNSLHDRVADCMPSSPPPSYKSYRATERPGIHIIFPRDETTPRSNPPTYRLRPSSRPALDLLNNSQTQADNNLTSSCVQLLTADHLQSSSVGVDIPPGVDNPSFTNVTETEPSESVEPIDVVITFNETET